MPEALIVTPQSAPDPLLLVGEELTILASGAQTGGWEIFLQAGPEGAGPPPHNHPWDEAFYVMAGSVQFGIGEDPPQLAEAGTLVNLPAGTTHWFRIAEDGTRMLSMTSREGASHLFTEVAEKVSPTNPDLAQMVEIGAKHGLTVAVPAN